MIVGQSTAAARLARGNADRAQTDYTIRQFKTPAPSARTAAPRHASLVPTSLAFALMMATALPVQAVEVGARVGSAAFPTTNTEYDSREAFVRGALPMHLGQPSDWHVASEVEINIGELRENGEKIDMAGLGLSFALRSPQAPLSIRLGLGSTRLSASELGTHDFGGKWQITVHGGLYLALGAHLGLGYRFQHTSNANRYPANDAFDLHVLEASISF